MSPEDQMSLIASRRVEMRVARIKWDFIKFASASRARIDPFIKLEHSTKNFPEARQISCSSLNGTLRKWFSTISQTLFGTID